MKFFTTISKNLKLLFRNKESAYTIVFGPILIILLVSFAFLGASDDYTIRLGVYDRASSAFSAKMIEQLNTKDYLVSVYPTPDDCINSVKTSATHICMVFDEKIDAEKAIPIMFYLDLSQTNIIYQISDDLEGQVELQANDLREQLANDAIQRLATAESLVNRSLAKTEQLSAELETLTAKLSAARDALQNLSNTTGNVSEVRLLKGYQQGFIQDSKVIANATLAVMEEARDTIVLIGNQCSDCDESTETKIDSIKEDLDAAEDTVRQVIDVAQKDRITEATVTIDRIIQDLTVLQASMEADSNAQVMLKDAVNSSAGQTEDLAVQLRTVSAMLRYTKDFLSGSNTTSKEIAKPVSTSIVSVTVTEDRLSFAYPYLLILVIMFIGMLLSSTLVVMNKTSTAAFRNFTTATSDAYHIFVSFITAFFLLLAEVIIILAVSTLFVSQPLFLNFGTTLTLIIVAIILFTFLGMIIGYLSKTHEASMIASITFGCVFLFISNLVIPIEGMRLLVQMVAKYNPYVVLSELVKKSMLYGVSVQQVTNDLLVLGIAAIILLILTVMIQKRVKKKFFRQESGLELPFQQPINPEPLQIGKHIVHDEMELLDVLDRMTRADFEEHIHPEIISQWVVKELKNKSLGKRLRTKSKEQMILAIDKYLQKHGKRMRAK